MTSAITVVTWNKDRPVTTLRDKILARHYSLYEEPGYRRAAREIDNSIKRAHKLFLKKIGKGESIESSVTTVMAEVIKPVMEKWRNLGSGDTEPEWDVVDVLKEYVRSSLGIDYLEMDDWDLRGYL
jgi:hypothetical protein